MRSISRRQFVELALAHSSLASLIGCGTVLHPERRGQPAGPLDWKIVALNTVGLLLFFVPGVIAFAVDFSNGTIYLPPDQTGGRSSGGSDRRLVSIKVSDEPLTVQKLENVLSTHAKKEVQLTPGAYQTEELSHIGEFWKTAEKHWKKWLGI